MYYKENILEKTISEQKQKLKKQNLDWFALNKNVY